MNDKKDPPKKAVLPSSKRKPPASLFLWLLAFLVLASLIVFQSSPYFAATEEWSANQFLSHLEKGEIVTAEVLPESDKILAISGEFKIVPKAPAADANHHKVDACRLDLFPVDVAAEGGDVDPLKRSGLSVFAVVFESIVGG